MPDLLHKTLGPYQIVSVLGRGGFAVVYKARDTRLDRIVALKVLHPYWSEDPGFVARFQQEARAAANLRHRNIVTVYDASEAIGQPYIAMEYLPGRTLRELLEGEGALSLERALPILEQAADALDYAHRRGVVHRDIKPGNMMVEETERGVHVTLMDFGLAKAMGSSSALTSTGTLLGTPEYMAPEQADPSRAAEVGPATDCYALGIVAYQTLTGRVPFIGETPTSVLYAHVHKQPPLPSELNPAIAQPVEAVVLKALEKSPQARYHSSGQMVAALEAAIRQSQSVKLENLYARAARLMTEGKLDEAVATWEELCQLKPDYKDAAAQLAQAQRQRDVLREYRDLAQVIRQSRERVASFAQRNPHFPDPERILKSASRTGGTNLRSNISMAVGGTVLLLVALGLIAWAYTQIRAGKPGLQDSLALQLLYSGNFNLGLGLGIGLAGVVLLLVPLGLIMLERLAPRH